jgi:protein ImuB
VPVPSYDDLTPSIPDVHPRDTFDQVTHLVPHDEPVVERRTLPDSHAPGLFAALIGHGRTQKHPELFRVNPCSSVTALAKDFSPRIERHGDECVVLDIAGLGRLLGDAQGIGSELLRTAVARGIKCSIGIAPTQVAARLIAMANDEVTVVTGDVATAVAPLPLDLLSRLSTVAATPPGSPRVSRVPRGDQGSGGRLFEVLRRWGMRTLGEFAALPPDDVAARFGASGVALQRLARGIDPRPLDPDPGVPRFIETMELEWPVEELEPLSFVFARLLDPLAGSLERADKAAAAIRADLRLVNRTVHSRLLQLPAAIRDPRVLRTLLLLDLESHPPAAGIDIVTLEVDPAPSRIVQFSLLERATPSPETLATLTARLNALIGDPRVGSPVLLDSHRPDAFEMQRFNPSDKPRLHDELKVEALIMRRFRPPVAIRVTVEKLRPVFIAIDRKGMPGGKVEQAAGPWRSSGAWWDGSGTYWDRDEWDVSLSDGSVCRIYRDRVTDHWFLDGVLD